MKEKKTRVTASFCIVRYSSKLRTAIKFRLDQRGYTVASVAKETELNADRIRKYLRGDKVGLSQFQVIKLASFLGIEVNITVNFVD
jgi:hypothetical protein